MTDVTVITATIVGREDFLRECQESVANQTFPAAAHLVYKDRQRRGIQHSMNSLWPQVKTPWMQWLADDDLLMPHHLEALRPYMLDHDIIHSYCEVEGRPGFLPNWSFEESRGWLPATALMRTKFVAKIGGWSPVDFPEDHAFWMKAHSRGAKFAIHRKPTWIYRFHGANLSLA